MTKETNFGMDRRGLLLAAGAAASLPIVAGPADAREPRARGSGQGQLRGPGNLGALRKLGSLEVSAIGLGVQNNFRKYTSETPYRPEQLALIRSAFDHGVTFFDCAEAYGPHECERILGEAIQPFRDKVVITSKFGWDIDLETGQRRPGLNSRPDHIKLVVDKMGLKTLRRAHAELPVTAVQSEYSMLWRGPEQDVLSTCEELGIGFVPWSPLGVQFLTGWIDASTRFAPGDIRAVEGRFAPENRTQNLKLVALVKEWAQRKQAAPGQIALAWLLAQKPWIVPIPGTTIAAHMVQNVGAAAIRFTPAELAELNSAVRAIEIVGQRLPDAVLAFSGVEAPPKR